MPHRSPTPTVKNPSRSPYAKSRRVSGQPKSSRQQFSACGACRMRRVRCDLKDISFAPNGQQPSCSNCKERGLKCVDEFAEVKAVKLLRRGRRLQQVETVYGKSLDEEGGLFSVPSFVPSLIPKLHPQFFSSDFFRRFQVQHPVIDTSDFAVRFSECTKGNYSSLGIPGQILSVVFAVWAVSFGVNEYGIEGASNTVHDISGRQERTNEMVREILQLVDVHGIWRRPTWDGVRALLLLLPLTQDVQTPMERLVTYEATVSQVFALCSLESVSSVGSGQGQVVDVLVRARIFWYSHIVEGITSGLRGGRLLLSDDDLLHFEQTLPSNTMSRTSSAYSVLRQCTLPPLNLACVCRKVHAVLTGPKARQDDEIDVTALTNVWTLLEKSWKEFDGLRSLSPNIVMSADEVEHYVSGWQIFIFECLNVIREALKQRIMVHNHGDESCGVTSSRAPSPSQDQASRLLKIAEEKCHGTLVHVLAIIRQHLTTSFFEYDAYLARDGCFFAGFLLACGSYSDDDVQMCLRALRKMRWAFSKSEEREKTIKTAWEARKVAQGRQFPSASDGSLGTAYTKSIPDSTCDLRRPLSPLSIPSSTSSPRSAVFHDGFVLPAPAQADGSWESPPPSAASSGAHSHSDLITRTITQESSLSAIHRANASTACLAGVRVVADGLHRASPSSEDSTGSTSRTRKVSPALLFYPPTEMPPYSFPPGAGLSSALHSDAGSIALSTSQPSRNRHSDLQDSFSAVYRQPSSYYPSRSVVFPSAVIPAAIEPVGNSSNQSFGDRQAHFQ